MILTMTSKVFLNHFIAHELDKTILEASYIIASNKIRVGARGKKQAHVMLYPSSQTIMTINDEKDVNTKSNSEYIERYLDELDELSLQMAISVMMSIKEDSLVIILTTDRENDVFHHLKMIREWTYDNLGFKIGSYKKDSSLSDFKDLNKGFESDIISLCKDVIRSEEKRKKKKEMKTENGRRQYFSRLGKKKLKKLLKKEGVYLPGMDEAEMIDTALVFLD